MKTRFQMLIVPSLIAALSASPALADDSPAPAAGNSKIKSLCSDIASQLKGDAKDLLSAACTPVAEGIDAANQGSKAKPLPRMEYSGDSPAFSAVLTKAIKTYVPNRNKHGNVHRVLDNHVTVDLKTPLSVDDLSQGRAPAYNGTEVGIWLNEIKQSGGKYVTRDTNQGAVKDAAEIAIKYVLAPLVTAIVKALKANPYKPATYMDAILVSPTVGPNAGRVVRVCFVSRGKADQVQCAPAKPAISSK